MSTLENTEASLSAIRTKIQGIAWLFSSHSGERVSYATEDAFLGVGTILFELAEELDSIIDENTDNQIPM